MYGYAKVYVFRPFHFI